MMGYSGRIAFMIQILNSDTSVKYQDMLISIHHTQPNSWITLLHYTNYLANMSNGIGNCRISRRVEVFY